MGGAIVEHLTDVGYTARRDTDTVEGSHNLGRGARLERSREIVQQRLFVREPQGIGREPLGGRQMPLSSPERGTSYTPCAPESLKACSPRKHNVIYL